MTATTYTDQLNIVSREYPGDLITPVLAYKNLREKRKYVSLLESAEGIGRFARYSYICFDPELIVKNNGPELSVIKNDTQTRIEQSIFDYLKTEAERLNFTKPEGLPDFTGGYVGYIGYRNISLIENSIAFSQKEDIPDSFLCLYTNIAAFDHHTHKITLITYVDDDANPEEQRLAYNKLDKIYNELAGGYNNSSIFKFNPDNSEIDREKFTGLIKKCKEHILNGDVFQIVLSHRFNGSFEGDLFNVYRALRSLNPSPYMFYLDFEELAVTGASPEDLVKVKDGNVEILPIAGTRRRGKTPEEDADMENDLLNDPKEIAEHTMLVDLARNDLGKISQYGSIKITESFRVHRFSHVMHIVSRVRGTLREGQNCVDALKAAFPAGTVTGAPKIKAVQLLDKYEEDPRSVYGGGIGYMDFSGNLDFCLAIRTLYAKGNKVFWQAGAGIVLDSRPELEIKEIYNKASVITKALEKAGDYNENSSDR